MVNNRTALYPSAPSARTRWIGLQRRAAPARSVLDPDRPYAFLREQEIGSNGGQIDTATIFLTNRECPFRCLMCDLWINTLEVTVPAGAIARQIRYALDRLSPPADPEDARSSPVSRQVKLYNAGSFFDPRAIPVSDYPEIASAVEPFDRVVVECHPALVGERAWEFAGRISGRLEVAIGLETAHPEILERLNKRFTVDDFRRAADALSAHGVDLRVFLLLRPPFMGEAEGIDWCLRSLETAFDAGAGVCCVIPTRAGNGAMERLAELGEFSPPSLRSLEEVVAQGIRLQRGRVFADLWEIEKLFECSCSSLRARRLAALNRTQQIPPPVHCERCGAA